jgi:hypothetical protein
MATKKRLSSFVWKRAIIAAERESKTRPSLCTDLAPPPIASALPASSFAFYLFFPSLAFPGLLF